MLIAYFILLFATTLTSNAGTLAAEIRRAITAYDEMAVSSNQFAFDLFKAMTIRKGDFTKVSNPANSKKELGNVIFSPFSTFRLLSMLSAGARGNSFQQIAQTLNFAPHDDSAALTNANEDLKLNKTMETQQKNQVGTGSQLDLHQVLSYLKNQMTLATASGGLTLDSFSAMYPAQDILVKAEFKRIITEYYKSIVKNLDFARDPRGAEAQVNADVAKATRDIIHNLIPKGTFNALTRLVLTDALYFKGDWKDKFDPNATKTTVFYDDNKSQTKIKAMTALRRANIGRSDILGDGKELITKVLRLDYNQSRFAMYIILPPRGMVKALLMQLNADSLQGMISNMYEYKVNMTIPKFDMEYEAPLKELLQSIGITDIFSGKADLTGMSENVVDIGNINQTVKTNEDLYVDNVIGKAKISVDERGSTAAQATTALIYAKSVPLIIKFNATSPFIYLIKDMQTGLILFMGVYAKPPIEEH